MSDSQKLSKAQRKKQKKAEKRKASGSPGEYTHSHNGSSLHNTSVCDTSGAGVVGHTQGLVDRVDRVNQDRSDSERYVQSVLNFNPSQSAQPASPMMNFNQAPSYCYQTPQNTSYPNQTPGVFMSTPVTANASPPEWAIQLIEDVRTIKAAVPKIDKIEQAVRNMELKISSIENKIIVLETKVQEVEQSAAFINSECETQKKALKKTEIDMGKLSQKCSELEQEITECRQREEQATNKLLDLEARSMRDNLIFYGIPEDINEQRGIENCEKLVKELITSKLHLDASDMHLDRVHRLGGVGARKPRPIVAKFHRYTDRELVRTTSQDTAVKTELRGSNQGIGVQSPQPYREARKALGEHADRERSKGQRVRITGNKLFVNNKPTKKYTDGKVVEL